MAYFAWMGPATIFQHVVVFGGRGSSPLEGSSP
jgi:hypothetical protein